MGFEKDMSYDQYAALPGVRSGTLNGFAKTPAHVRYALDHGGKDPTPALERGWLLHLAVLEPDRYVNEVAVAPKIDRRTKAGKNAWAFFVDDHPGATIITEQTATDIECMRRSVTAHPIVKEYLAQSGKNEMTYTWSEKVDGRQIACKARIDRVAQMGGWPVVADLKTARDGSPRGISRAAAEFGWHVQAAHYVAGLDVLAPIPPGVPYRRFIHIVVENTPPFCSAVYELDDDARETGDLLRKRYLRQWAECNATDDWPGYPTEIDYVGLPRWAVRVEESSG